MGCFRMTSSVAQLPALAISKAPSFVLNFGIFFVLANNSKQRSENFGRQVFLGGAPGDRREGFLHAVHYFCALRDCAGSVLTSGLLRETGRGHVVFFAEVLGRWA